MVLCSGIVCDTVCTEGELNPTQPNPNSQKKKGELKQ